MENSVYSVRGVVFDIGGVLEYTPEMHVISSWETRLGLPGGTINQRLGTVFTDGCYGRITESGVRASIAEQLQVDRSVADALMEELWIEYLGTPNHDLLKYFGSLKERCPTAILSNSFVGARKREEEHIGLNKLTDIVVYSHEVGYYKPEQEIYQMTCERLGMAPSQVAFLDDNPEYLRGAEQVGMYAIPFTTTTTAIEAIERWLAGD